MLKRSFPEPELYPEVSNRRSQSTHTRIPLGKLFAVGRLSVCQKLWEASAQLHPPKWTLGAAKYAGQKVLSGQAENQQLHRGAFDAIKRQNKTTRRAEPWLCGPRTSCWGTMAWGFLEDILPVKFFLTFENYECLHVWETELNLERKKETLKLKICFPPPKKENHMSDSNTSTQRTAWIPVAL